MAIEHDAIPDSELHEPKGANTASANQGYVADGLGSGSFKLLNPFGSIYYKDLSTGTNFTDTSYALLNVTTTTSKLNGFTQNSAGRLTYTGTPDIHLKGSATILFDCSSSTDIGFIIYKNGSVVDVHEVDYRTVANVKKAQTLPFDLAMSTNDYIEVYQKTGAGTLTIHALYLQAEGLNA